MIGVVTHRYLNGDLDIWFAAEKFGSTYFRMDRDGSEGLAVGQKVLCQFEGGAFGTVVNIAPAEMDVKPQVQALRKLRRLGVDKRKAPKREAHVA